MFIFVIMARQKRLPLFILLVFFCQIIYKKSGIESEYEANDDLCDSIPKLDPWHPSILAHIEKPTDWSCNHPQKNLSHIAKGKLHIDFGEGSLDFCRYRCFKRDKTKANPDYDLTNEYWQIAEEKVIYLEKCEFIEVSCEYKDKNKGKYQNFHWNFRAPKQKTGTIESEKTSVVILLFDSVSHAAFQRSLPKTYKVKYRLKGTVP